MRCLLVLTACLFLSFAPAQAFESLEIPEEAVKIDDMHPIPELKEFTLVGADDMACMAEFSINQCERKVYTDDNQRLLLVFMENAPAYYWYYHPEKKEVSATPFQAKAKDSIMVRDPKRPQAGAENRGDYFSNSNKQRGGNMRLFDF